MEGIYKCPIFQGLTPEEINLLLNGKFHSKFYKTGETIAFQGDKYRSLLIVDKGIVRGEMINFAGDHIVIEEIASPRSVAPAILYATDNTLPVDVIAVTDTEIISIHRNDFTRMLQTEIKVLHNFMQSISDRSKFLSDRVRILRFGTIKSKLAGYLLEQAQRNNSLIFDIPHTHQELADLFGVSRPALSRVLGQIAETGMITSRKNHFQINDRNHLLRLFKDT